MSPFVSSHAVSCRAMRCNLDVGVSFAWRFSGGMQSMTLEPQKHILIHYVSPSDSFTTAEPEHTLTQNGKTRCQCTACTDRCVRTDLDMHEKVSVLIQIPLVGRALGSHAQCMRTTKQHMSRCNHTDRNHPSFTQTTLHRVAKLHAVQLRRSCTCT